MLGIEKARLGPVGFALIARGAGLRILVIFTNTTDEATGPLKQASRYCPNPLLESIPRGYTLLIAFLRLLLLIILMHDDLGTRFADMAAMNTEIVCSCDRMGAGTVAFNIMVGFIVVFSKRLGLAHTADGGIKVARAE